MIQMDFLSISKQFNAINAIQNDLPQTDISGCFFHLLSNLLKHIRTCWIERTLHERTQFGLQLRMIAALAFVPTQDLVNSFDELCVSIRNQYDGDADEVLDYFEHTYIGCFCRKAPRRPPLYPIELWSTFKRPAEVLPLTNNKIEAWHNSF